MPSKTKSIVEHTVNGLTDGFTEYNVSTLREFFHPVLSVLMVAGIMITVFNRQYTYHTFNGTGSTQQMTCH